MGATAASLKAWEKAAPAPQNTTNFLVRGYSVARPGPLVIEARTEDGSQASAHLRVDAWTRRAGHGAREEHHPPARRRHGRRAPHRGPYRVPRRAERQGVRAPRDGHARRDGPGDDVVSLNALITDSSPGMSAYATGQKANNNQEGVFPDNTQGRLRQPAHRICRRAAAAHAWSGIPRRHRDHSRRDRFHAGCECGSFLGPLRGSGHRGSLPGRAGRERRQRAARWGRPELCAKSERRRFARTSAHARR